MVKKAYINKRFHAESLERIKQVNTIIADYHAQGYDLTLRQVYYQLVSRDLIENTERSYKRLGELINNGRLAGLIDWNAIIYRTRNMRRNSHWDSPGEIITNAKYQFFTDKWEGQEHYVEVWVEKDALIGVIGQTCEKLDVPYFSCRGFVSQSEMYAASQRIGRNSENSSCTIFHLGDHDPSGIDMTRDIIDRLEMFECAVDVRRIGLNMDQVKKYNPPPNPAKITDSRFAGYAKKHGTKSWELDALNPSILDKLIRDSVTPLIDKRQWNKQVEKEEEGKNLLEFIVDQMEEIEIDYKAENSDD